MSVFVCDPNIAQPLIQRRKASGLDRYDEVWDGVYVMSPMADNEHQGLATAMAAVLTSQIDWKGRGRTLAGANVSDRSENWTENYRVPDVLVFLTDCTAEDRGSHWFGGPDFAVEIVSEGDRTFEKLDFYAKVGVRELLVIHRNPWQLTFFRQAAEGEPRLLEAAAEGDQIETLASEVLRLKFQLDRSAKTIRVLDVDGLLIREIPIHG